MTIFLGLTGSIGMGKSTTATMFKDAGIPVHDSDATVHRLYAGPAAPLIEQEFPGTVSDGVVDRSKLGQIVIGNETEMKRLEAIIHPLVWKEELSFRNEVKQKGSFLAIIDNPLLFEAGRSEDVDGIIVVTAPYEVQKERVLARPGMSEEKFLAILERQVPDAEKRKKADFIIDTSLGMDKAQEEVSAIISEIESGRWQKRETVDA